MLKKIAIERIPHNLRGFSLLLLALFFLLPFQKGCHRIFQSLARALIPLDLTLPPAFSKKLYLSPIDLAIAGIGFWLLLSKRVTLRRFFWDGPAKYLLIFTIAAFVSVFFSSTAHYLLQYLVVLKFSLAVILFNILRTQDFSQWLWAFAWVVVIISLCECFLGIAQYFSQHSLGLRWLGESNIATLSFNNPSGKRWLFDSEGGSNILLRTAGTFGHANPFGGFLFLSTFFSYYLLSREQGKKRLILQGAIFLQIFTLCTTFSRSAMISLLLCSVLYIFLSFRDRPWRLAGTLLASCLICLTLFHSQFFARGGIVNYNEVVKGADQERLLYQKMALKMFQEHPVWGVGYNNFQFETPRYLPEEATQPLLYQVHNIYLLVAAETGLIGLAAFLLFFAAILKSAYRARLTTESNALLCVFLGILLIGMGDMYPLLHLKFRLFFFAIAALLYCSVRGEEK